MIGLDDMILVFWMLSFKPAFQFSSVAQSCPTLCDPMNRSTPGLPVHHQLPEFTQTHTHRVSDAIQSSHPLSSPSPPSPNPSQHQSLFSNESTICMRWPKYWSFSFSIIPSKEIPGLISLRMDWLDLLSVQESLSVEDSLLDITSFYSFISRPLYYGYWRESTTLVVVQSVYYPKGQYLR